MCLLRRKLCLALLQALLEGLTLGVHLILDNLHDLLGVGLDLLQLFGFGFLLRLGVFRLRGRDGFFCLLRFYLHLPLLPLQFVDLLLLEVCGDELLLVLRLFR